MFLCGVNATKLGLGDVVEIWTHILLCISPRGGGVCGRGVGGGGGQLLGILWNSKRYWHANLPPLGSTSPEGPVLCSWANSVIALHFQLHHSVVFAASRYFVWCGRRSPISIKRWQNEGLSDLALLRCMSQENWVFSIRCIMSLGGVFVFHPSLDSYTRSILCVW